MPLNYREVTDKLSEQGCHYIRKGKGSHKLWYSPMTDTTFPVSDHKGKDIPKTTIRKIQRQSGVKLI